MLQWNMNGLFAHLPELQNILAFMNPYIVCLQATHLKITQNCVLSGYDIYRNDRDHQHASGGILTMVKNSFHSEQIHINSDMGVVAIKIHNPLTMTLCNIYFPPNLPRQDLKVQEIIDQLPTSYILFGDFNAHNVLWHSDYTDSSGRYLEDIFDSLTILNTGSPTHLCARTGNFSIIDLTVSEPRLVPYLSWETLSDLHGSDHFPIIIRTNLQHQLNSLPQLKKKMDFHKPKPRPISNPNK